jgi:hypothetical protein
MSHRQAVDYLGNPIKQTDTWFNAALIAMCFATIAIIYYMPAPEAFGL